MNHERFDEETITMMLRACEREGNPLIAGPTGFAASLRAMREMRMELTNAKARANNLLRERASHQRDRDDATAAREAAQLELANANAMARRATERVSELEDVIATVREQMTEIAMEIETGGSMLAPMLARISDAIGWSPPDGFDTTAAEDPPVGMSPIVRLDSPSACAVSKSDSPRPCSSAPGETITLRAGQTLAARKDG